jgi:hypothetical protein
MVIIDAPVMVVQDSGPILVFREYIAHYGVAGGEAD